MNPFRAYLSSFGAFFSSFPIIMITISFVLFQFNSNSCNRIVELISCLEINRFHCLNKLTVRIEIEVFLCNFQLIEPHEQDIRKQIQDRLVIVLDCIAENRAEVVLQVEEHQIDRALDIFFNFIQRTIEPLLFKDIQQFIGLIQVDLLVL